MGKKRRHHYVPRFYLERFADPKNYPFVWVYEKGSSTVRRQKADNIAFEKDFYSYRLPSGEADSETIENALGDLESQAAPLFKKIEAKDKLADGEKAIFSNFLSYSMTRVPNYRRNMESIAGKLIKNVMLTVVSDRPGFEKKLNKYEKQTGRNLRPFIEKFIDTSLKDGLAKKEFSEFSLEMIDMAREFAEIFYAMRWAFLESTDEYKYLTSDNPLYYFDPKHNPKGFDGVGLLNDNTEVYFPISKDLVLMGNWKNIEGYYRLKNTHIRDVNKRTVIFAQRYVFASQKSRGISVLVDKYKNSHPKIIVA